YRIKATRRVNGAYPKGHLAAFGNPGVNRDSAVSWKSACTCRRFAFDRTPDGHRATGGKGTMGSLFSNIDPLYVISGVLVGGLVGFTGVGGGSLMTPILILVFGVHPSTAVGTDLLYACITKTGGSVVHGYNKTIDWKVVGLLALGSVPMTALSVV